MRVNIYAEELTKRIEVVTKTVGKITFYGLRFYLELPVTVPVGHGVMEYRGRFQHHPDDDDSAAVTFWHTDPDALRDMMALAVGAFPSPH